jgi:hypothetical protein
MGGVPIGADRDPAFETRISSRDDGLPKRQARRPSRFDRSISRLVQKAFPEPGHLRVLPPACPRARSAAQAETRPTCLSSRLHGMVRRSNESGLNRGARSRAPITEQGTKEPSSPWAGTESSNLAPSSAESVSALRSRTLGEEPRISAAVCAALGTREVTGWLRTRPFGPFFSDRRWGSPTLKASSIPRTCAGHGKAAAGAC